MLPSWVTFKSFSAKLYAGLNPETLRCGQKFLEAWMYQLLKREGLFR
jgi:hypothetical protein